MSAFFQSVIRPFGRDSSRGTNDLIDCRLACSSRSFAYWPFGSKSLVPTVSCQLSLGLSGSNSKTVSRRLSVARYSHARSCRGSCLSASAKPSLAISVRSWLCTGPPVERIALNATIDLLVPYGLRRRQEGYSRSWALKADSKAFRRRSKALKTSPSQGYPSSS